ncbi:MAG: hypothetical protein P8Y61_04200 [Gammaproteobacteria bacterium]|jgi:hypothetical protein
MGSVRIILDLVGAFFIGAVLGAPIAALFFVAALACELLLTAERVKRGRQSLEAAVWRDRQFYRAD